MMMATSAVQSILRLAAIGMVASITSASSGCEGGNDCTLVGCYRAPQATIEVLIGSDTTRRSITGIRYDRSQPNGEDCDATCHDAQATVALTQ